MTIYGQEGRLLLTAQSRGLAKGTHHIVVVGVKRVEEACCTPAAAANDESLLGRVMGELGPRRLVLLGEVVERHATGDGDESDATGRLEEPPPERDIVRRRWWGGLELRRNKARRVDVRIQFSGYEKNAIWSRAMLIEDAGSRKNI